MYQSHPKLEEPKDSDFLWRYMDFQKFFSILENQSLYFTKLISLSDPFEGQPTRSVVDQARYIPEGISNEEKTEREHIANHNMRFFQDSRTLSCVSCWHANQTESAAMWELYMKSGEGLAIRTTFERFKTCIGPSEPHVYGGLVKYVDYDTYHPGDMNIIGWAVLKRQSFEHEKEFRGIVMDPRGFNDHKEGISIPIDIDTLIESIYVSPTTQDWVLDLLNNMLKRYSIGKQTVKSNLHEHPMYLVNNNIKV